jgi:hypothetical protein
MKKATANSVATKKQAKLKRLSKSFKPLPYTVILGKGKLPAQAIGNRRLCILVQNQLERYANAGHKKDKTSLVWGLFCTIQDLCCHKGAFVKFDGKSWWEVSDLMAREKIATTFRNYLHSLYRSSNKNKAAKRRAVRAHGGSGTDKAEDPILKPTLTDSSCAVLDKIAEAKETPSQIALLLVETNDNGVASMPYNVDCFDIEEQPSKSEWIFNLDELPLAAELAIDPHLLDLPTETGALMRSCDGESSEGSWSDGSNSSFFTDTP